MIDCDWQTFHENHAAIKALLVQAKATIGTSDQLSAAVAMHPSRDTAEEHGAASNVQAFRGLSWRLQVSTNKRPT